MNRQVWREAKDLMVLVNSSGAALLAAMDGERPFTEIVAAAFANTDKGLKGINLPDLKQFGRGWEYEDRFFTSSAFLMALWTKGFIHLMLAPAAGASVLGHGALADGILLRLVAAKKALTAGNVTNELIGMEADKAGAALRQIEARLLGLLAQDALLPSLAASLTDSDKPDLVPDSPTPAYQVAYVKPALLEQLKTAQETLDRDGPMATMRTVPGTPACEIAGYACGADSI
jgi:hypothetical protein